MNNVIRLAAARVGEAIAAQAATPRDLQQAKLLGDPQSHFGHPRQKYQVSDMRASHRSDLPGAA